MNRLFRQNYIRKYFEAAYKALPTYIVYGVIIVSFFFISSNKVMGLNKDHMAETANHFLSQEDNFSLKDGFVYLDEIDPSILVDIRYSSKNNLKQEPLLGIKNNRAVLSLDSAVALRCAQEDLRLRGYSLVVYNAYIPNRSYLEILDITQNDLIDQTSHPNISHKELIKVGYLQEKLDNIRGSTVDVSIIPLNKKLKQDPITQYRNHSNNQHIKYVDDGSEDMGTSYDTFDELSCHECKNVRMEAQMHRELLKSIMEENGFKASDLVWWKYTYMREPYPDSQFDFEI